MKTKGRLINLPLSLCKSFSPQRLQPLPSNRGRRTDDRVVFFPKAVNGGETQGYFIQDEEDGHEDMRKLDGETREHSLAFDLNSGGTIRKLFDHWTRKP